MLTNQQQQQQQLFGLQPSSINTADTLERAILEHLELNDLADLADGHWLASYLLTLDQEYFGNLLLPAPSSHSRGGLSSWVLKAAQLKRIYLRVSSYLESRHQLNVSLLPVPDLNRMAQSSNGDDRDQAILLVGRVLLAERLTRPDGWLKGHSSTRLALTTLTDRLLKLAGREPQKPVAKPKREAMVPELPPQVTTESWINVKHELEQQLGEEREEGRARLSIAMEDIAVLESELKRERVSKDELEQRTVKLEAEIGTLSLSNYKLIERIDELESQQFGLETESELGKEVQKLKEERNSLANESIANLQLERDSAMQERDSLKSDFNRLLLEMKALRSNLDEALFERRTLRSNMDQVLLERDTLKSDLDQALFESDTLKSQLSLEIEKLRADLTLERESLQACLTRTVQERDALQADLAQGKQAYKNDLDRLRVMHELLEQEYEMLSNDYEAIRRDQVVILNDRTRLEQGWEESLIEQGNLRRQLDGLQVEHLELRQASEMRVTELQEQVDDLMGQVANLKEQVALKDSAEVILVDTKEQLAEECALLKSQLEQQSELASVQQSEQLDTLNGEIANMKQLLAEQYSQLEEKNYELESLKKEYQSQSAQMERSKDECNRLSLKLEELLDDQAVEAGKWQTITRELEDQLKGKLDEKERDLEAIKATLEMKEQEMQCLREDLASKTELLETKEKELQSLASEVDSQGEALEKLRLELTTKEEMIEAKDKGLQSIQVELESNMLLLQEKEAELQRTVEELEAKQGMLEGKENELQIMQMEQAGKQDLTDKELQSMREEFRAKKDALEFKEVELQVTRMELAGMQKALEAKNDDLCKTQLELQVTVEEKVKEIESILATKAALHEDLEAAQKLTLEKCAQYEQLLSDLQAEQLKEFESMVSERDALLAKCADLEDCLAGKELELTQLEGKHSELFMQLEQGQSELLSFELKHSALLKQLEQRQSELSSLELKHHELLKQFEQSQSELSSLASTHNELLKQLEQSQSELSSMTSKYNELLMQFEQSQSELSSLKLKHNELLMQFDSVQEELANHVEAERKLKEEVDQNLAEQLEEYSAMIDRMAEEENQLTEQLANLNLMVKEQSDELSQREAEIIRLRQREQDLLEGERLAEVNKTEQSEQLTKLNDEYEAFRTQHYTLKREMDNIEQHRDELEIALKQAMVWHGDDIDTRQKKHSQAMASLVRELHETRVNRDAVKESLDRLALELERLQDDCENMQAERERLQDQLREVCEQLNGERERCAALLMEKQILMEGSSVDQEALQRELEQLRQELALMPEHEKILSAWYKLGQQIQKRDLPKLPIK